MAKRNKRNKASRKASRIRNKLLFVYGTLQGSELCKVSYLAALLDTLHKTDAEAKGKLYLPHGLPYPIALFAEFLDDSYIQGKLLTVSDEDLELLDVYENTPVLYHRIRIKARCRVSSKVLDCFAYMPNVLNLDCSDAIYIQSGDYVEFMYGGIEG